MWRYALRRVLLMLPTLGLILFLAFLLQSYSAKDEVASLIALDGERGYSSRASYMKAYKTYAQSLGYDRPLFYCSIGPSYLPKDIYQIIPKIRNTSIRRLLKETQDAQNVMVMATTVDWLLSAEAGSNTSPEIKKILTQIETAQGLQNVKSAEFQLRQQMDESDSNDAVLEELVNIMDKLEYDNSWVWPKFIWHGRRNRFHLWLSNGLKVGGGASLVDGTPASSKVYRALRWTLAMSLITLVLIAGCSLLISILQVYYHNSLLDKLCTGVLYAFYTMPLFWIATIMVVFFTTSEYGSWTNIFPSVGIKRVYGADLSFFVQLANNASRLVLPVLLLSLHPLAYFTKQLKEDMKRSLDAPYVLAARARGLNKMQVILSHVVPNSMISFVTLLSGGLAGLFTGSIVIEVIFNIPGLGRLLLDSMQHNDWPVIFLIIILVSISTMLGYLIGDIWLAYISPKIRQEMKVS